MKKVSTVLFICCAALHVNAAEPVWSTDIDKTVAQAKAQKKEMLLFFTGTGWVKQSPLVVEGLFSTEEFKKYASEKLILHVVDFPKQSRTNAVVQSKELKEMNEALRDYFKVKAYPTFILLNSEGYEIGRLLGYTKDSPRNKLETFMAELRRPKYFNAAPSKPKQSTPLPAQPGQPAAK